MKDLFIISCMFLSIIRLSASEFKHKKEGLLYCKNESKYFVRENSADFVFSEINSIDTAILPHKKRTNEKIYWDIDPGVVFNDYKYGGLGTGFFVDLSINRITLTFRTFTGRGNAPEPKEKAFMIGVNYREKNLFADFVAGIGSITYWCTNGLNQNCNNTTEGSAS